MGHTVIVPRRSLQDRLHEGDEKGPIQGANRKYSSGIGPESRAKTSSARHKRPDACMELCHAVDGVNEAHQDDSFPDEEYVVEGFQGLED